MDSTIFRDLLSNAALLLAMSVVYELRYILPAKLGKFTPYLTGLLISVLCIGVMSMPFQLTTGLFFDTRTILLGVSAALFGGIPTLIAVVLTAIYRMTMAGVGMWMGVLTIASSAGIGLIWRRYFFTSRLKNRWVSTYILGVAVHVTMLACAFVLPWELALQTLRQIALPVMLIYPVGTVMLSLLLIWQKERRESEQIVAEAEERYRSLFESSQAAMLLMDPGSGQIVDANPAAAQFYQWPQSTLRGMSITQINLLPQQAISGKMHQSLEKMKNYFIFKHRRADGSVADVEVYSGPIRFGGKTLLYSIVHDITNRAAADLKLLESETRLKSAQALAHVGNWELDLMEERFWTSEECFIIYGLEYTPQHPYLEAKAVRSAVFHEDRPMMDKAMQALVENNEPYDVEFRIKRASDGVARTIHSIARRELGQDGKPTKIVGVIQDITQRKLMEMELAQSEAKHREMIANIADVISIAEPDGTIKYISPNNEKWFGFSQADVVGQNGWDFIHPDDEAFLREKYIALFTSEKRVDAAQCRFKCKDGGYRMVELTAINLIGDPVIGGVLMNYHDVTERNLAQMEYKALLQATMDGFCIVTRQGSLVEMNDTFCSQTGYSQDELKKMTVLDFKLDDDEMTVATYTNKVLAMGYARFETRLYRKDGKIIDVEVSCNSVRGNFNRVCIFLRDITDRKRHEDEVVYLSRHDTLTGLYNRSYFEDEFQRQDDSGQLPFSVIMGDINGLKLTNDIFGHAEGDKLLSAIASILKRCCRSSDIVTRVGGDEFNILLPGVGKPEAQAVCERIYRACEESEISTGGRPFHPSISLGCAAKTKPGQAVESVLKDAEDSMYRRKLLERKSMHSSLISSIKATMLEKSHDTNEHAERLIQLSKAIGWKMNLSSDQINELELLAALHDIGKIGIDDRILTSPNRLSEQEWEEMKKHPEIGYRIALAAPELVPIANFILSHHERWDGTGYPQKLKGDKIPLLARIITVLDSYDAMTSDRAYRKALPKEAALEEIRRNAGSQFDPDVAKIFLEIVV